MNRLSALRPFLGRRLRILAAASLLALLAGQTVPHWFAGLFAHFVPHYAALMLLAALLLQGRQRLFWGGCAAALAAWMLMPWQPGASASGTTAAARVLWYNVNLDNAEAAAESVRLLSAEADIIALAEIDTADAGWQALRRHYPHGCTHEEDSPFALAVWSKTPPGRCEIRFAETDAAGAFPYIRMNSGGLTLYALHPPPPVNAALAEAQVRYLDQAAAEIAAETGPVLLVGDLNMAPYSPLFRRFAARARLSPQTRYLLPTWLPFGLNIDHAMTRGAAAEVRPLPFAASDHRPLLANTRF